jgi:hypothetical protein
MRRRKLLVALTGLAVVGAAGAVVVLWPRAPSRITRENFDRICEGMSRAEVEAILGPPGDYRTGHGETGSTTTGSFTEYMDWTPDPGPDIAPIPVLNWSRFPGQSPEVPHLWASWLSDSFEIQIAIDHSGGVAGAEGYPRRTTQGPLDSLLWHAKRQWRRWFP